MAIKFNIHAIGNPSDACAPKKFYARPVHSGETTLEDLVNDITNASSVNEADVHAVLYSLIREIPKHIARGNIVRLGHFGSFRLSAKSNGSDSKEKVSADNIINARIIFHAGKRIKKQVEDVSFKRNK